MNNVHPLAPVARFTPQLASVGLKKLPILQLAIVFPLFSSPVVADPLQYMLMVGVDAPSRMSQSLIRLSSLPIVPVVDPNSTTPEVGLVVTPVIVQNSIVLFDASFSNTMALPVGSVLSIIRAFVVPIPPGLPSIVTYRVPSRERVAVAPEEIANAAAVAAGLMVRVLLTLVGSPLSDKGKVSPPDV